MKKKNAKKDGNGRKNNNAVNVKGKDKKTPVPNGTFTKNIVFKEVLTT